MGEQMTFPDTWEEFEECYGFTDREQIYTNGSRLIQSFRVEQWLDHLPSAEPERKTGQWISEMKGKKAIIDKFGNVSCSAHCSECGDWLTASDEYDCRGRFCPNCGADMREVTE